jgi:hypothetical protein
MASRLLIERPTCLKPRPPRAGRRDRRWNRSPGPGRHVGHVDIAGSSRSGFHRGVVEPDRVFQGLGQFPALQEESADLSMVRPQVLGLHAVEQFLTLRASLRMSTAYGACSGRQPGADVVQHAGQKEPLRVLDVPGGGNQRAMTPQAMLCLQKESMLLYSLGMFLN